MVHPAADVEPSADILGVGNERRAAVGLQRCPAVDGGGPQQTAASRRLRATCTIRQKTSWIGPAALLIHV